MRPVAAARPVGNGLRAVPRARNGTEAVPYRPRHSAANCPGPKRKQGGVARLRFGLVLVAPARDLISRGPKHDLLEARQPQRQQAESVPGRSLLVAEAQG